MRLKKLLLSITGILLFAFVSNAQTVLSSGDLWILSISGQGTPDEFTFVSLVDLDAGTVIRFTDQERDGSTGDSLHPDPGFNDAIVTYTVPSGGIEAGTVVKYPGGTPSGDWASDTANPSGNGVVFGNNGDKIIAYQTSGAWNDSATYLAALGNGASYGTFPAYFTDAINMGTNQDGDYTIAGGAVKNSTRSDLESEIADTANWTWANGSSNVRPLEETDFRIGYFWDGSTWTPSNPGAVGSAFDDDIIIGGTGATFSGNTETNNNVYVDAGATLDIGANTLTADSVFIAASASGQGQVKGSVTGDVEFQTYITSSSARWFNLGFPVNGALSKITMTGGGIIRTDADGPTVNANVYWYDPTTLNGGTSEGTWTVAADQTPAADANGWSIYLGGGAPFGTLPITISSYGVLNSGDVDPAISTDNGGWNFMNNPYAATIDWEEVIVDNGTLENTFYILDDENGWWRSYNATTNLPSVDSSFIPAGQAFFVQTTSPTTLAFREDQIDLTVERDLLKVQMPKNVMLKVYTSSSSFSDFTVVSLKSGATDNRDPYIEGVKRMNHGQNVPSLYSVLNDVEYTYNIIGDQFAKKSIPVSLVHDIDDEMTIALDFNTLGKDMVIEIEDKLSGDIVDLRQENYTFRHVAGNDPDRFILHLSQSSVGIDESGELDDNIFAYTQGEFLMVNLENLNQEVTIQIFDMGGKMLLNKTASGGEVHELMLPNQSQGVYLLKVVAEGQLLHSQKIMK